jgi:glutamine amidotransferase-like uncharacterized protein
MKFGLIYFLIFIFSANAFAAITSNNLSALIYHGPGTCTDCPESIGSILKNLGFKIKYAYPGQLTNEYLAKFSLYVQPGGSDDIEETLNALSKDEINNLQKYIASGGKYLGVCAGAYLAGQYSDDNHHLRAFGLIPIDNIQEESKNSKAKLISVNWLNQKRYIYFQAGPSLGLLPFKDAEVIARYSNSGNIAALITHYGIGNVGLIGPHLEADIDWYKEDHLSMKHGLNIDLMVNFINKMFN